MTDGILRSVPLKVPVWPSDKQYLDPPNSLEYTSVQGHLVDLTQDRKCKIHLKWILDIKLPT